MRKITTESVQAFLNSRNFKKQNMEVQVDEQATYLKLHGHKIAHLFRDGTMLIDACGWLTNTTKERLNGLPGVNINQKNFEWFLNGKPWNGSLIKVTT